MQDEEFMSLVNDLQKHLGETKIFVKNHKRIADVEQAAMLAHKLFPDAKVTINDDPLQLGALILRVDCTDLIVRGQHEIDMFAAMIKRASNFEFYAFEDDSIRLSLVFSGALTRI